MSRVGKKPIDIPAGVEVFVENRKVKVKGPKGELLYSLHTDVAVKQEGNALVVSLSEKLSEKQAQEKKNLWGLTRSLVSNMIEGVQKGYEKRLEIEGIGYRANVEGDSLNLSLGFSHARKVAIPKGLLCSVDKNVITISGIDKQQVGEFAAAIRRLRPVEPYKGKGVKYQGEQVRRKEGKKAAGASTQ